MINEDDIINAVKMLQEKNLGFKSKEKAVITIATVARMKEYYNNLFLTHTGCNELEKKKIDLEIAAVKKWLTDNKGTKAKL